MRGCEERGSGPGPEEEAAMREAVIVEALRTPIARGKLGRGGLSGMHPARLLARMLSRRGPGAAYRSAHDLEHCE